MDIQPPHNKEVTLTTMKAVTAATLILCVMFVVLIEQQSRMIDKLAEDLKELREENLQLSDVISEYQTEIQKIIDTIDSNKYYKEQLEIELKHEIGLYLINRVIEFEEEWSNLDIDPGGETRWGVSKTMNAGWLPATREEAVDFYYDQFWIANQIYKINNVHVAFVLLDSMVLFGPTRVKNIIIKITKQDSYDKAIDLINTYDERKSREFMEQLKTELRKVVQTLVKNNSELKVFAKGWNKRIDNY